MKNDKTFVIANWKLEVFASASKKTYLEVAKL